MDQTRLVCHTLGFKHVWNVDSGLRTRIIVSNMFGYGPYLGAIIRLTRLDVGSLVFTSISLHLSQTCFDYGPVCVRISLQFCVQMCLDHESMSVMRIASSLVQTRLVMFALCLLTRTHQYEGDT